MGVGEGVRGGSVCVCVSERGREKRERAMKRERERRRNSLENDCNLRKWCTPMVESQRHLGDSLAIHLDDP